MGSPATLIHPRCQKIDCAGLDDVEFPPDFAVSILREDSARASDFRNSQLIRAELPSNGYPRPAGSSGNARHFDFIRAELPSNGYRRPTGSSENAPHFDSIRAELPSNGYPQPSGSPPASILCNTIRRIWIDWMSRPRAASTHCGFRSRQGRSPRQARALVSASPYLRLFPFSPGSSTYEGEAVDTVTPAGLPQEPSPNEEDKLWYATSMSVSSGP